MLAESMSAAEAAATSVSILVVCAFYGWLHWLLLGQRRK